MKNKMARVLLAALLALSPAVVAQAQQPQQRAAQSDEELIQQYKARIQFFVDNPPPAGATEETRAKYHNSLRSLRGKLRDQLVERRGVWKEQIRRYQAAEPGPERDTYLAQLDSELQSVAAEVQGIDRDMEADAAAGPVPRSDPAPRDTPAPEDTPEPQPAPQDADPAVIDASAASRITDADLRDAAAPPELMESKIAVVGCNEGGQPASTTFSVLDRNVCRLSHALHIRRRPRISLAQDKADLFSILVAKLLKTEGDGSYARFISDAHEARTDQQMGAGPSSSGTTSLVSKGGIPYAFAFAMENGAATRSISDTTVTFRINPGGLYNLAARKGFITGFRESENQSFLKFLRKTSVGLTFDTLRGNDPGVFTGGRDQLSEVNVKLEIFNERDPRHRRYEAEWENFVATEGVQMAEDFYRTTRATVDFGDPGTPLRTFKDPALQAWLEQTNRLLGDVPTTLTPSERINAIATLIRSQADLLPVDMVSEQTVQAVSKFAAGFTAYERAKDRLLDRIARGKVLTFEYTNRREVNAPDTSNLNFVYATGMGRRLDLTANGSLTFFHQAPAPATPTSPAPGKIRDFQFAVQGDVPLDLRKMGVTSQVVLWFSGRFERLMEDATNPLGTTIADTKGNIGVGQVGLRIPIGKSGLQLPLSFTFANRTELIKEKTVRGNLGFTFNLDSILARFKPF